MPLGSLLGPLEALLGGLKSEKMQTVPRENHFFENVALLVFEAPDGPLGLILLLLGQTCSQNGVPEWVAKVEKKISKNRKKHNKKKCSFAWDIRQKIGLTESAPDQVV